MPLSHRLGPARCCRRCWVQARLEACSRCQQPAQVASRTAAGEPVCSKCFRADPANHDRCTICGRTRPGHPREDGSLRCRRCYRPPLATCTLCGREKPCYLASSGMPRCENCSRQMRRVCCAGCGRDRAVWARTAGGRPLCGSCSRQRVPCTGCGNTRTVAARLPAGPLCSTCYRKHPASFQPCTECGTTERLYHHGLCTRCACRQHLLSLLSHDHQGLHPHAEAIYHVLAASDPVPLMRWLTGGSAARTILAEISRASQPPGHAALDRHLPSRAARHLRKILVAGGVLPARDERLAELERWAEHTTGQIDDPAERRIVRSFTAWHHLRRLRRQSGRHHITAEQADHVQHQIRATVRLISWLRSTGTNLAACTQRDIDTWLASGTQSCYHARAFVAWATTRGHTRGLDIPTRARSSADPGHHAPGAARTPGRARPPAPGPPPRTHRRRPHRRPPMGIPRRSTSTADLRLPPQDQARVPGHTRPLRTQHRPRGSSRQDPGRRARPPARHPHQHRRRLGRTSRQLTSRLRRASIPPYIQQVLISLVTNTFDSFEQVWASCAPLT